VRCNFGFDLSNENVWWNGSIIVLFSSILLAKGENMKSKRAIAICAFVVSLSLGLAGASEVRLTNDASTPAAVGKAHLNKEKNGNLKLKVEVYHLAKPSALTPSRQTYVVWTQARGKDPQNQGVLKVNDKLEGTFEDTVSNQDFDLFITAEDSPAVQAPSEPKLLKGSMRP
jgi:hypothetical protein